MEMSESVDYKLGRIEGKLDMILAARVEDGAEAKDVCERVESLEKFKWMLFGGATTVSTIVAFLANVLIWHR